MSTEDDDVPDERLRRELARLPRELAPPKGLEARVVAALRERGRLATARPRFDHWRLGGAIAASLVLLLGGFLLGRQGGHRGNPPAAPSYLLILSAGPDFNREGWSDDRLVAEMAAWARHQLGVRHFRVGERLDRDGWIVKPSQVAWMSPTQLQDAPDGFFIIVASSDQEALAIARTNPMLRHGGRVQLRRIHP